MSSNLILVLRLVGIAVVGYLIIALGQVLVLEVGIEEEVSPHSSGLVLLLATLGTIASGLVGGYCVAWLGRSTPRFAVGGVIAVLLFDTVWVIVNDVGGHPVWFNLGGSFTLIAATITGAWARLSLRPAPGSQGDSTSTVP